MNAERTDADRLDESPEPRTTPGQRSGRRSAARSVSDADERPGDGHGSDPASAGQAVAEPHASELHASEPHISEPRASEPRTSELRTGDRRVPSTAVPTNIYRARRPGVAILLVIPAIGVALLLLRALAIAAFGDTYSVSGILASTAGLVSLPLIVAGLYGLVTGAAHGAEHYGFKVWARPPLAYLLVGLAFAAAAGLAVR